MKQTSLTFVAWLAWPGSAAAESIGSVHWINDIAWPLLGLLLTLTGVFGSAILIRRRNQRLALEASRASRALNPRTVRQRAISEPNWLAAYSSQRADRRVDDLTRIEGIGPKVWR